MNPADFMAALAAADTLRARNGSLRADVAQLEARIGQMRKALDRVKAVAVRVVGENLRLRAERDAARDDARRVFEYARGVSADAPGSGAHPEVVGIVRDVLQPVVRGLALVAAASRCACNGEFRCPGPHGGARP